MIAYFNSAFEQLEQKVLEGSVCFPKKLWLCMQQFFQNLHWENFLKDMEVNPVPFTFVHGDFHPGNVMWMPDDPVCPLRILDWEMVGVGSGPQELGQFMIGFLDHERHGLDVHKYLVSAYHKELLNANRNIDFTFEACFREFAVGGIRDWMRLLPELLERMEWKPDAAAYFLNQLETFRELHCIDPEMVSYPNQ